MKHSKYWRAVRKIDTAVLTALRNSTEPLHKVTHREPGDIPGLILAPRESIFRPDPLDVVQAQLAARTKRFIVALDTDQYGESFRGKEFSEPLFGPYGEKL